MFLISSVPKGDNDCGGADENGRSWCAPILNQVYEQARSSCNLFYAIHSRDNYKGDSAHTAAILLSFCRQIASGMVYLSGKGFIHRDLAARNILISHQEMCKVSSMTINTQLA